MIAGSGVIRDEGLGFEIGQPIRQVLYRGRFRDHIEDLAAMPPRPHNLSVMDAGWAHTR
jgi:hypothetical protein